MSSGRSLLRPATLCSSAVAVGLLPGAGGGRVRPGPARAGPQPSSGDRTPVRRVRCSPQRLGRRAAALAPSCYRMQFLYCLHRIQKIIKPNVNLKLAVRLIISCHFAHLPGSFFLSGTTPSSYSPLSGTRLHRLGTTLPQASRCGKRNLPLTSSYSYQLLVPL